MLRKSINFIGLFLVSLVIVAANAYAQKPSIEPLILEPQDRILVLAPHPDDEILGAAGVIQRSVEMKLPVKIVFLTLGDSNQWSFLLYRKHPVIMPGAVKAMGLVRKEESIAAARLLGLDLQNLIFLGYPDFGTLNIWYQHWDQQPAYKSIMTQVKAVPYQGSFRLGAAYKGEEILADLRTVIKDFNPTKIFVSHPADHNGDHLSLYLYLRVALWDLNLQDQVQIYPYLIHYIGWPHSKEYKSSQMLKPPASLSNSISWKELVLTEQEFNLKKLSLQAHKSQFYSTPKYLSTFVRYNELFGDFPSVNLHENEDSSVFNVKRKATNVIELPEELNTQERTSFIGVEWKFVRWQGSNLIISIELSKPLAKEVEAFIYIFGYNKNTAFEKMPKISVRLGDNSYVVLDQAKRIKQESVKVVRTSNQITIAVPLKLLGDPDRILTSARTYLGNVPLDSSSWIAVGLN